MTFDGSDSDKTDIFIGKGFYAGYLHDFKSITLIGLQAL
jgi:hypothetical protein